jgi:hypothetical protein
LRSLFEFEGFHISIEKLGEEHGHWRERLGFLLPQHSDVWWTIDKDTDIHALGNALVDMVRNIAVPEVIRHVSDDNLMTLWLSGKSPGLTNTQRLEYLTVLLKNKGWDDLLYKIVEELKAISAGKPYASSVEAHLKLLGVS